MDKKLPKVTDEELEMLPGDDSFGARTMEEHRPVLNKLTTKEREEALARAMRLIYGGSEGNEADSKR